MGSSERGRRRGAGAGGENGPCPRGALFRSGGETWRGVARGGPGLSAATFPGSAGALGSLPISSFRHPHPHPAPDLGPKFTRPPSASSLYPPTPTINPKTLKSGMGKEDRGEGARWAEYLLKGGCLLWNVDFFFSLPWKLLSIVGPHSHSPNLSFPSGNSSKILKENGLL